MRAETGGAPRPGLPHIADHLVNAVVVADEGGRVVYANPATGRLLGRDVGGLFGVPLTDLVPSRERSAIGARVARLLAGHPSPVSEPPARMTMVGAGGEEIPVDAGFLVVTPDHGAPMTIVALWDVHDRVDISDYQRVSDDLVGLLSTASGTVAEVVHQLLATLGRALGFQIATAWRWDQAAGVLRCEHGWHDDPAPGAEPFATVEASLGMTVRPGEGLAGFVVDSGQPYWTSDLVSTPNLVRHDALVADGLTSAFLFPIRSGRRLVGVIELFTTAARALDGPLLEAVGAVGTRLGEFVERVELENLRTEVLAGLERSRRRQDFLLRAHRALTGAHGFADAVEQLAAVAVPMLGDVCLVDVVEGDRLVRLAARHADPRLQPVADQFLELPPDPDGPHPAAQAVRTGRSRWSSEMGEGFLRETTLDERHLALTRRMGFRSYLSVPLMTDRGAIGALTIITTSPDREVDGEDLALAEDLAGHVAAAIERARTLDQQSGIAHLLQTSLLPTCPDRLPGLELATRYAAGSVVAEVGGDFYDVVPLGDGRVVLVIGDVEGHDMTAATVMGQLRSALRAYLRVTHGPAEALDLLDRHLAEEATPRLATACLVQVRPTGDTVEVATAGHPPPLVVRPDGIVSALDVPARPPLGLRAGTLPAARFPFPLGATLVLYTDGLTDTGRPDDDERLPRLERALAAAAPGGPARMADAALRLAGGGADDVAVLVARSTRGGVIESPSP